MSGDPDRRFEHPRTVLRSLGIPARKRLSQNFLCHPEQARRIVDLAWWPTSTPVLEVGGGTGTLTGAIVERYPDLTVIELDRALASHLRDRYADRRVEIVEADARTIEIETLRTPPVGVFGNLPYAITTDLLMWLIRQRRQLAGGVVMVQKEYADRLVAKPGTKAYGSLSVFSAFHLESRGRMRIGTGAFYPRPKVESTVLALGFRDPPGEVDPDFLERVVRVAFAHRRKMLRSNLAAGLSLPSPVVEDALARLGLPEKARAEELSPERFLDLAIGLGGPG